MHRKKTLIFGDGACADAAAEIASANGVEVVRLCAGRDEILSVAGAAGDFGLMLRRGGNTEEIRTGSVVVAEEARLRPDFSLLGLRPSPGVISLPELSGSISGGSFGPVGTAAFLVGLMEESDPVVTEGALEAASSLQNDFGARIYFFTGNLKVAGKGLEALCRKIRTSGGLFFKITGDLPEIRQDADGSVSISFFDDIAQAPFTLRPELTVVGHSVLPSEALPEIARIFRLETDAAGFLQAENVRRLSVRTNRKGVFAAGFSRGVLSPEERLADAGNAAALVAALRDEPEIDPSERAVIEKGKCIHCLTCYRLCPHRAVLLGGALRVAPEACEGCGICAAECPRGAIAVPGFAHAEPVSENGPSAPFITAFCCSRSAVPARDLAVSAKHGLPPNLRVVAVPCAGGVSLDHILSAFRKGSDGVLVIGCHEGSCNSGTGTGHARNRVEILRRALADLGIEAERLAFKSLAANMGAEFADIAAEFEKKAAESAAYRSKRKLWT